MKLKDIDLNKLLVFSSVARHKGYKGASEELGLTRSAISQSVMHLEDVLGKKLFNRVGRSLQLTQDAARFYQELTGIQSMIGSTLSDFLSREGRVKGQLRVGAYLEFTKGKMMPIIEEFMTSHPDVQLKFVFDSPSRVQSLLERDLIDLSVSIFPHRGSKTIESKKLYREELVLIGHRDLLSAKATRSQLLKVPVLDYYPTHLLFRRWWRCQFGQALKGARIVSFAATSEMVVEMAKRKLGVGVVPRYLLSDDSLQIIQPTAHRLFDYVWVNQFKNNKARNPAHAKFLALLFERFGI